MKRILYWACILIVGCTRNNDDASVGADKPLAAGKSVSVEEPIDHTLQLYRDVLDQLVTKHFYKLYLGEQSVDYLDRKYSYPIEDTAGYNSEVRRLQQQLETDSAQRKSLYLNHILWMSPSIVYQKFGQDSLEFWSSLQQQVSSVSEDVHAVADSLNTPQVRYLAKDFNPTVFKLSATSEDSEIGAVTFSKPFINKSGDRGVLYYEFYPREKGSKGEILILELLNNKWIIKNHLRLWIE